MSIETLDLKKGQPRKIARTYMLTPKTIDLLNYLWNETRINPGEIIARGIINIAAKHGVRYKDTRLLNMADQAAKSIGQELSPVQEQPKAAPKPGVEEVPQGEE